MTVATRCGRVVVGGVVSLVLLGLMASPAGAHTKYVTSAPADGAAVEQLDHIDIRFTEGIEIGGTHVWIRDTAGYLELAAPSYIDGDRASLRVPVPPLGDGDYEVTWHVLSDDGTPVQGTFHFLMGVAALAAPPVTLLDPAADYPPDTSLAVPLDSIRGVSEPPALASHGHGPGDVTRTLTRGVLDMSLVVLVGGLGFIAFVWRRGGMVPRTRQILAGAAGVAAVSSFELSAFQLAGATGSSTFAALSPTQFLDVLDFRFGRIAVARLILLAGTIVAIAALARRANRPTPSTKWVAVTMALVVGLAETMVLLGHAAGATSVGGIARLTHVVGISAWMGGLVILLFVVLPRRRTAELLDVLPRFSTYATGAIVVLMVGGVLLSVDLLGSVGALATSDYGRVLLAKLVLVALLLMAASLSRAHVRAGLQSVNPDGAVLARPLVLWAGVEVGLMVAVLAVTAVLVSRVPPA
jgi:putative copper export protein/methionine-rich copper-binding protein CopC